MLAAQQFTAFTDEYGMPGIMLRDHYRCLPEIIKYCDELSYQGLLRPVRASRDNAAFPAMGYAHVRGQAERSGKSWRNILEARTIAAWLHDNLAAIMEWADQPERQKSSGKPKEEIVAVVTPYRAQVPYLRNEIRKKLLLKEEQMSRFTINTVHALQGAERDMVIFSPTVRAHGDTTPLHERDDRMLNVAVSRAKNCFLVIGDMELFTEGSRARPSRLLARHLYKRPENQLVNIVPSVGYITETLQSHVISGPDQHEKVLRQVLQQAREKILISSPFLNISAFTEEMLATMQECVRRGVKVFVATDSTFDVQHETVKEPARLARNRLSQIGATVWVVDAIHAKTLCMDSQLLVEGSFNWLSATRELEKARVERSLISENEERTRSYIEDAWEEIEGKPKKVWLT